ncbi:hypothetical protein Scep_011240 [Stephania cephalantha]|uniref:Uncharacterized protein n=1 Tax=Stephania cephalantha TaxID=152367 RepID=A0AAP0JCK7_9MAGN
MYTIAPSREGAIAVRVDTEGFSGPRGSTWDRKTRDIGGADSASQRAQIAPSQKALSAPHVVFETDAENLRVDFAFSGGWERSVERDTEEGGRRRRSNRFLTGGGAYARRRRRERRCGGLTGARSGGFQQKEQQQRQYVEAFAWRWYVEEETAQRGKRRRRISGGSNEEEEAHEANAQRILSSGVEGGGN